MKKQNRNRTKSKQSDSSSLPKSLQRQQQKKHKEETNSNIDELSNLANKQQLTSNSIEPKTIHQKLILGISKAIKEKVIPSIVNGLKRQLDKRKIWSQNVRAEGLNKLVKMTFEIVNYEQEKLENFCEQAIFNNQNHQLFKNTIINKKKKNDQLLQDILKTSVQIGHLVKKHKEKSEVLKRIQQKLRKGKLKIKPNNKIQVLKNEFSKLNQFLDKSQARCDSIKHHLYNTLVDARQANK